MKCIKNPHIPFLLVLALATVFPFTPLDLKAQMSSGTAKQRPSSNSSENSKLYRAYELGNEELIRIKAVDNEGKTFIVNKGFSDGVGKHQLSLFSNDNVSIKARAQEVSRFSSLWKVVENDLTLPFKRDDFVTIQYDTDKLSTEIAQTRQKLDTQREEMSKYRWKQQNYWISRLSVSRALSDSVSETTAKSTVRTGFQAELLYQIPLNNYFDFGFGGRIDRETLVQESPSLEIPTSRQIALSELTYNFGNFEGRNDFVYISAGIGYGTSETEVSGRINSGNALIFPFRLGYSYPLNGESALVTEFVTESISAAETLEETGEQQQTTIINSKISMGLRF